MLDDLLRGRGIRRVVHTHVDHFEPFRYDGLGNLIGPHHVAAWLRRGSRASWFAAVTPFFSAHAYCKIPCGSVEQRLLEGKFAVSFGDLAFGESTLAEQEQEVLSILVGQGKAVHVHVHHEHWTSGPLTGQPGDPEEDSRRLDAYLGLLIPYYRKWGGLGQRWWFVHGCWALQGSDLEICRIEDEMRVLMRYGCVGDMSFPAGRPHCDPSWKAPSWVLPVVGRKGYDSAGADPLPVGGGCADRVGRFLIWSDSCGTDVASLESRMAPERRVGAWLRSGVVIGDTLFIKTHGHSMFAAYWQEGPGSTASPTLRQETVETFDLLHRTCEAAGVAVEHMPASEFMSRMETMG